MTLPHERAQSVQDTRKFLLDLNDPSVTRRVPAEIRKMAASLLRHFPTHFELEELCEKTPSLFARRFKP